MIDEERWRRLDRLFEEAVALSGAEREDFVAGACADDAELRRELESLLAADGRSWSLVEGPTPVEAVAAPVRGEPESEEVPSRIGPYRVLGEIGRGGMGTVYAAVRDDDHYRQQVAIKLIHRGMDTEFILDRFRQERQILANLEHPGIARLLDGGGTQDDRPYLVMEHIEGEPVDAYCDRHRLPLRRRLELFGAICDAVHHAHRSLVVHRDLKPSNILVSENGRARLLDFGTAKLLDPEHGDLEGALTTVGWRLMTPAFASPEQVRGEPVTTATDVYSLGVLLHWLLVGSSPYPGAGVGRRSIEWAICEEEPVAPSAVLGREVPQPSSTAGEAKDSGWTPEAAARARSGTPRRLQRLLRGDLDAVVGRALAKDQDRRYGTVRELAEDVRRHLGSKPVHARRGALGYRLGRFARRNPLGVAATAAAVLALVGGATATGWQARVALAERSRAELAATEAQTAQRLAEGDRATAEEVSRFLQELFAGADPVSVGGPFTARELLDRGAERIGSLADRPLVQAAVAQTIGVAYHSLGEYDVAADHLEAAFETRRDVFGEDHLDVAESVERLARLHHDRGDPRAAEPLFRRVLEIRRSLLGEDDPAVLRASHGLGLNLYALGDYGGAEALLRDGVERAVALYGEDSALAANALNSLAGALYAQGDMAAVPMFERVLAVRRQSLGEGHPMVAAAMVNLAELRREGGQLAEAERLTREAMAIWRAGLPPEHPMFGYGADSLAAIARKAEDHDEAERRLQEALALRRESLPPGHPLVAGSLLALGEYLVERGRPRAAEPLLHEAVETLGSALPAGHWKVAQAEGALGACLAALGRPAEAEPLLVESRRRILERLGEQHPELEKATAHLVRFYQARGDLEAAARLAG